MIPELTTSELWATLARLPLFSGDAAPSDSPPAALAWGNDSSPWGLADEPEVVEHAHAILARVELWTSAPPLVEVEPASTLRGPPTMPLASGRAEGEAAEPTASAAPVAGRRLEEATVVDSPRPSASQDGWPLEMGSLATELTDRAQAGRRTYRAAALMLYVVGAALIALFGWLRLR
jgi:hypothetical protein